MAGDDDVLRHDGLTEAPGRADFAADAATAVVPFDATRHRTAGTAGHAAPALIRVLIIDGCVEDARLVRDLLARSEAGTFRVEHAADPQDGLARLLTGEHDVALVERDLDGGDGLGLVRAAVRRGLGKPLIVLGVSGEAGIDLAAIEAGAADFLDKEELAVERLERAIRLALARQGRSARLDPPSPTDPLTGLGSRHAYLERLERALARARRRAGHAAAMLIDIDRFAAVNRTFGHAAGDALLRLQGGRIQRHLRETDTSARLAGDRFALVLEDLARPEHAQAVAVKLLAALAAPATIAGATVAVTASAGAALFPEDGADAAALLALAETALGQAKRAGGNGYRTASARTRVLPAGDLPLATALERAIAGDVLHLLFQPQVTLSSPELGLSTQVRWPNGPAGGLADERVRAVAEAAALTEPLTDWLLAAACRQAARWRAAGMPALHVVVRLACRRQLGWSDLARRLEDHLAQAGMTPGGLELEFDETMLADRDAASLRTLAAVRELGVRLAVADYGAGPTSLALLRDLPLTTVKLAGELLCKVPEQEDWTAVTGSIVRLAVELGLRVVADGVETQAQLHLLRRLGCHAVQSPIRCPPLPAGACAEWLVQAARRS